MMKIVDRYCNKGAQDAFWKPVMGESTVRKLVREMLFEDLKGFQQRTKGIDYMSVFEDPTFDEPYQKDLSDKNFAKNIKRAWEAEADHGFMRSLIKVHWVGGQNWEKNLDRLLSLGGNNEISAMGYLPDTKFVRSEWGSVGVLIQGRVTLAANSMDTIASGYFHKVPEKIISKYKSSGVPRRATIFSSDSSEDYILDRESFNDSKSINNELVVDNWRPIAFVIGTSSGTFVGSIRDNVGKIEILNIEYAKGMMKHDLPIYDATMKLISRNEIEEALRGEGKDEDFTFP